MAHLFGILGLTLGTLSATLLPTPDASMGLSFIQTNTLPPMPPAVPLKPPTEFFRQLLAATPAERVELLAPRSPESRSWLLQKLQQYEAMPPSQSDRELRTLELRWYLLYLMNQSPRNRAVVLSQLAEHDRQLVAERLAHWDQLPPTLQNEVLSHERAIRLVVPTQSGVPIEISAITNLPSLQRQKIEADIALWKALPMARQETIYWHFQRLFELADAPVLLAMRLDQAPPPLPVSQALEQFKNLPWPDQLHCLTNFRRFTELTEEQRRQFLKGAARWQQMNAQQRDAWRQAARIRPPPPLPPMPPLLPPMPPGMTPIPRAATKPVSTN